MHEHMNAIVKNYFYYLRNIIRRFLSLEQCKLIAHTSMISKLDYCNVFLYGLPKKTLHTLQRVQNYASRLIKSGNATCVLLSPTWPPVELCVYNKVLFYAKGYSAGSFSFASAMLWSGLCNDRLMDPE